MGHEAENERLRLRASFYNSIAAGLALGGCLIPYFEIFHHGGDIVAQLVTPEPLSAAQTEDSLGVLIGFIVAFAGAKAMRRRADATAAKIQDRP